MQLKTIRDIDIKNKRVLWRVAYDITLKKDGDKWRVLDDRRIRETLPTLNYLLEQNCSVVLMSWLKRPGGKKVDKFKMGPVAEKLSELIGRPVKQLNDCIGPEVRGVISEMKAGDIVMLENTRFHPEEEKADPAFAKELAQAGEVIVFDAFAQAHRVHASTTGILERKPAVAGFLMEKELKVMSKIIESPMEPFVVVLGGAKISDKIEMMSNILDKASIMLIGGGVANTFFKAQGLEIGASMAESIYVDIAKGEKKDYVGMARDLLKKTINKEISSELEPQEWPNGHKVSLARIQLPIDVLTAPKIREDAFNSETVKIVRLNGRTNLCTAKEAILDIGPYTVKIFSEIIKKARTIFWNGPMGVFEEFDFSKGTEEVARAIAESNGFSVIGGGDTEGVASKFKLEGKFGHVSTGGGASLALLAGMEFPVLRYLTVSETEELRNIET